MSPRDAAFLLKSAITLSVRTGGCSRRIPPEHPPRAAPPAQVLTHIAACRERGRAWPWGHGALLTPSREIPAKIKIIVKKNKNTMKFTEEAGEKPNRRGPPGREELPSPECPLCRLPVSRGCVPGCARRGSGGSGCASGSLRRPRCGPGPRDGRGAAPVRSRPGLGASRRGGTG